MHRTATLAIQGPGSASILDAGIIASLLKKQTGIQLEAIPEDDIFLKLEWLKNGKIDSM